MWLCVLMVTEDKHTGTIPVVSPLVFVQLNLDLWYHREVA